MDRTRELQVEDRCVEDVVVPVVALTGVCKSYGSHEVLTDVELSVYSGEIVGLIGANGAGKTTLLRVLGGIAPPSRGEICIRGEVVGHGYDAADAWRRGIALVHQELSLCSNLTVWENWALLRTKSESRAGRPLLRAEAAQSLERVFPGSAVAVDREVASLTLAQQQMIEIARAASSRDLRLLVLDEPTSALAGESARKLRAFLRRAVGGGGLAGVYVTHKLEEVLEVADRIVVLRNGVVSWSGPARDASKEELVVALGGSVSTMQAKETALARSASQGAYPRSGKEGGSRGTEGGSSGDPGGVSHAVIPGEQGPAVVSLRDFSSGVARTVSLAAKNGETVGIAGLEGAGQRDVLQGIFRRGKGRSAGSIVVRGAVCYVPGDRQSEGIFSLWDISKNILISALREVAPSGFMSTRRARTLVDRWFGELSIAATSADVPITDLSGGNQQKVLIARALASGATIFLLDDPTRGVDIGTKQVIYQVLERLKAEGKTIIWYSTEDEEFLHCDRVYVLARGQVSGVLAGPEIAVEGIVRLSYPLDMARGNPGFDEGEVSGESDPRD